MAKANGFDSLVSATDKDAPLSSMSQIELGIFSDRLTRLYNGTYTITSALTGAHRTFQIKTAKKGPLEGKRIVSMLTGPNNEADYVGFGFVDENGIRVWSAKRTTFFLRAAKMLWVMGNTGENNWFGRRGCKIQLSKRCVNCNRKLTDPESIRLGIGPVCRAGGEDTGDE